MSGRYREHCCSLIVLCSREWVSQLGWEMLYKRKRLVMAIAARVLVLVKSMETTHIL